MEISYPDGGSDSEKRGQEEETPPGRADVVKGYMVGPKHTQLSNERLIYVGPASKNSLNNPQQ